MATGIMNHGKQMCMISLSLFGLILPLLLYQRLHNMTLTDVLIKHDLVAHAWVYDGMLFIDLGQDLVLHFPQDVTLSLVDIEINAAIQNRARYAIAQAANI